MRALEGTPAARQRFWVLLALALGIALRLSGLGVQSLWYDEGTTICAGLSPHLVATLSADRHPPLFFQLCGLWIHCFGEEDATLRLLPALLSCCSLVLFAALARRWLPAAALPGAVALQACSPFLLWHGQELRMYALVELAVLLVLLGLAANLQRGPLKRWGLAAILVGSAVATGSQYYGALIAPALGAVALAAWAQRSISAARAAALIAACALGILLWTPWFLVVVPRQLEAPWAFQERTGVRDLIEFPARLVLVDLRAIPAGLRSLGYLPGAVVLAALLVHLLRCLRAPRAQMWWPLLIFALPALAALGLGLIGPLNFRPKYLIASAPGLVLVTSSGLAALPWRVLRRTAWVVLLLGCLGLSVLQRSANRFEDYRSACAELVASWRPSDRVVVISGTPEPYSQATVRHYLRRHPRILASILSERAVADLPAPLGAGERLHVIYRTAPYAEAAMRRVRRVLECLHQGELRFRILHALFRARG